MILFLTALILSVKKEKMGKNNMTKKDSGLKKLSDKLQDDRKRLQEVENEIIELNEDVEEVFNKLYKRINLLLNKIHFPSLFNKY